MVKHVKRYLVPHEGNNFVPHILRAKSISLLALLVVAVFAYSGARDYLFLATDWGAEVLSSALVGLTNGDRANAGLNQLTINDKLVQAAQLKASDMASRGYFAHVTPDGKTPWYFFSAVGYDYEYAGENLAINFVNSDDVERAWMNSPTHRSNLLNQYFTEIGIATAQGYYNGQPTVFVVQEFGKPRSYPGVFPKVVPVAQAPSPLPAPVAKPAVKVSAKPAAPKLAEEVVVPSAAPKEPKVIIDTGTLLAVHYEPGENAPEKAVQTPAVKGSQQGEVAGTFLSLPSGDNALDTIYIIIGLLIIVPLILLFRHELKTHHYRHIAYGLSLLSLMAFLLVALHTFLPQGFVL